MLQEKVLSTNRPPRSVARTVTVYGEVSEASLARVPVITPVAGLIVRPAGSPVAV